MRCRYCLERIYTCNKCEQEFRLNDKVLCVTERLVGEKSHAVFDIYVSHVHRMCSNMISSTHSEVIE